jgi:hypothetical protein
MPGVQPDFDELVVKEERQVLPLAVVRYVRDPQAPAHMVAEQAAAAEAEQAAAEAAVAAEAEAARVVAEAAAAAEAEVARLAAEQAVAAEAEAARVAAEAAAAAEAEAARLAAEQAAAAAAAPATAAPVPAVPAQLSTLDRGFENPIYGMMVMALVTLAAAVEMMAPAVGADLAGNVNLAMRFAERKFGGENPHGLTVEEIGAIHLYTQETTLYRTLNAALRDKDRERLKPFFAFLKLLLTALYKLPRVKGMVCRGVKLPIAQLGNYAQGGEEVVWWGFSSTTTNLAPTSQFLGKDGDRTMFHIQLAPDTAAVQIHHYSALVDEEVLLPPGTCLRVESSSNCGNGLHIVVLQQLSPPPLMDFARPASPEPAAAAPAGADDDVEDDAAAEWACPMCTFTNNGANLTCEMCGTDRAVEVAPATAEAEAKADMERLQVGGGGGGAVAAREYWRFLPQEEFNALPRKTEVHIRAGRSCLMISEEDGQLWAGGARPDEGYHREQVFFLERVGSDADGHHLVALRSAASGTCLDRLGWAFFGSDQLGVNLESRADTDIAETMLFAVEMSSDGSDGGHDATAEGATAEGSAMTKFALRHVDTGRYVTRNRPKRVGQAASLTLSSRRSLEGAGKPGLTLLQLEVLVPTPTYNLTVRAAATA